MQFLAPMALWWSLVLLAVVALYVFKRRSRPVVVTTMPFFLRLHRHLQEAPWLRRLKRLLSFLLIAAMFILLIVALAKPVPSLGEDTPGTVVVMVDRSASMAASSGGDQAMAQVRRQLRHALAGLPPELRVALVAVDGRAAVLAPPGSDRQEILEALEELRPVAVAGEASGALALARDLVGDDPRGEVWWASDRPLEGADRQFISSVGGPNAGITAFALRRNPLAPETLEAFLAIAANTDMKLRVEAHLNDELVDLRSVEVSADEELRLVMPVVSAGGEYLRMSLHAEAGADILAADNAVMVRVPPPRRVQVDWVSGGEGGDGFTALALATQGEQWRLRSVDAADWAPGQHQAQVVVAQEWVPSLDQLGDAGLILINPPQAVPELGIEVMTPMVLERPRRRQDLHQLLLGVNEQRLQIFQTGRIDGRRLPALWSGPSGNLWAAGMVDGRPVVVMTFDPLRSPRLALTSSWPSLLANALAFAAGDDDAMQAVSPSGSLLPVPEDTQALHWRLAAGGSAEQPVHGGSVLLQEIGSYRLGDQAGAAALLSLGETRVPLAATDDAPGEDPLMAGWLVDAISLLALVVALLACVEAWLFHRKGIF